MKIIRATIAQFAQAGVLLSEYYEAIDVVKRDTPEEIAAYLNRQDHALWIAYIAGVPAGCVALRPLALAEYAVECKRLYVRPEFRSQGIAEALLNTMEEFAQSSPAEAIYLDSKDDLTAAINLYIRRGYQPCERYNDNPQATVFLKKRLDTAASSKPQRLFLKGKY